MVYRNSCFTNSTLIGLFLLTLLILAAVLFGHPGTHGLQGQYYDNTDWDDTPVLTAVDAELSRQILREQEAKLPHEVYTVTWSGTIDIPTTGFYTLMVNSDDGTWLWIDDILVADSGGGHRMQQREGVIHLRKGGHRIKVQHLQAGGETELELWWQPEGAERTLLPPTILSPSDITTRLWLYHTAVALIPWLAGVWAIVAAGLALTSSLRGERPIVPQVIHRLWGQPVQFAIEHLKKRRIQYWILVVVYVTIIFLTLSYARTLSTRIIERWGENLISTVTAVMLIVIGAGIVIYFGRIRQSRISRLLIFVAIAALYVYFLNSAVRGHIHAWSECLDDFGDALSAWGMFPITASEKVHFLEYGLLGILFCKALSYHIRNKMAYVVAALGVYIVGVLDEGIQWALPNRVGDYRDLWLNLLSGVLAIAMVGLVIRPRIFQRYFRRTAVRPACATLAVAAVITGIFLQVVNGFGTWIALPDPGVRFVSAFSETRLLALDMQYRQRSAGQPVEEIPPLTRRVYEYEAHSHEYFRNWYHQHQRFFESSCEQAILTSYFRGYLHHKKMALIEYPPAQLMIASQTDRQIVYSSRAQAMVIIAFNSRRMWTVIMSNVAALGIVCIATGQRMSGRT